MFDRSIETTMGPVSPPISASYPMRQPIGGPDPSKRRYSHHSGHRGRERVGAAHRSSVRLHRMLRKILLNLAILTAATLDACYAEVTSSAFSPWRCHAQDWNGPLLAASQ